MPRISTLISVLVVILFVTGCSGASDSEPVHHERTRDRNAAILDGVPATAFPEAVLVNSDFGRCSGVLVRPDIVLTAAHCIRGANSWLVIAPNPGPAVTVAALGGKTFDETDDPNLPCIQHDIGLLVLASPIDMSALPVLPTKPMPADTQVLGVGRKHDTTDSSGMITSESNPGDQLFVSKPVKLQDPTKAGCTTDYQAFPGYATHGDSGGPALLTNDAGPHVVVGVSSQLGFASEGFVTFVARVDLETEPGLKDYVTSVDLSGRAPEDATILDPCGGETFAGHCNGDVLSWCQDGAIQTMDCSTDGNTCGFDSSGTFFNCR